MGLESCAGRARMALGSSTNYTATLDLRNNNCEGAVLNNDSTINPQFYNWNKAWLPYCGMERGESEGLWLSEVILTCL